MLVWMNTKRNGSLNLLNFRYIYFELGVENWLYDKVFPYACKISLVQKEATHVHMYYNCIVCFIVCNVLFMWFGFVE